MKAVRSIAMFWNADLPPLVETIIYMAKNATTAIAATAISPVPIMASVRNADAPGPISPLARAANGYTASIAIMAYMDVL